MRALVTGGKGFIGSHLCDVLRARGWQVSTWDKVDGQDILDEDGLDRAVAGCQVVFGCAGKLGSAETFANIEETVKCNILGPLNVLKACWNHERPYVYLSLKNEWRNPYMITKHTASEFCRMYYEYYNLPVAVVCGLNAYGPGQHWGAVRKMIPTFIMQALKGEPLMVYGDGQQIVDLIYVDDLAEIMVRCWEHGIWGQEIDGGTGIPLKVVDVARMITRLCGSTSDILLCDMRKGEPKRAVALADPAPVLQLLGYYPETPLEQGMAETIYWYRRHGDEVFHA